MYNDPNCKPWTSGSWTPVGYGSRSDFLLQKKAVETKNTFDSGAFEEKATGRVATIGSASSFENENEKKENEKSGMGNGIRISVSGVNNRSSSILENEGRASRMGSDIEIIGSGVDEY